MQAHRTIDDVDAAATGAARRRLRVDAEQNRAKIVQTARQSFARDGLQVSVSEIARRSGVGLATVLRRFTSKEDLVLEVLSAYFDGYIHTIEAALQDEDPWRAFTSPIERFCADQAADRGLATVRASGLAQEDPRIDCAPLISGFDTLAARAKAAGFVRPEITYDHLMLLLKGNAGVVATSFGDEVAASRAYVAFALHAFRNPARVI